MSRAAYIGQAAAGVNGASANPVEAAFPGARWPGRLYNARHVAAKGGGMRRSIHTDGHAVRSVATACLALAAGALSALAAPYDGETFTYYQPDGAPFPVRLFGDEFYAVAETPEGYVVTRDPDTGFFCFAELTPDRQDFAPAAAAPERRVGRVDPAALGLTLHLRIAPAARLERVRKAQRAAGVDIRGRPFQPESLGPDGESPDPALAPLAPPSAPTVGSRVGLVLLIRFPDRPVDVTISQSQVDSYCNEPGTKIFSNPGSAYDYYYIQSGGRLRYTSIVTAYYTATNSKAYYDNPSKDCGTQGRLIVTEALAYLRDVAGFDFSRCDGNGDKWIDGINAFYAGTCSSPWSYGLWPHSSSVTFTPGDGMNSGSQRYQITDMGASLRLGTYCHENGHMICRFPDLYDYGYESYGAGAYTLMAYHGTTPVSVDAYLKYKAGWSDVVSIDSNSSFRGCVTVDRNWAYRYVNPTNSREYFMIETRQKRGYETATSLPDQGLLVWHVDESGSNNNEQRTPAQHYEVSAVQADNAWHLETHTNTGGAGDLFHFGDKDAFHDGTAPNAHWWAGSESGFYLQYVSGLATAMTFVVGSNALASAPDIGVDAGPLAVACDLGANAATQKLMVWNRGGGTLSYTIADTAAWLACSPTVGTAAAEGDLIALTFSTASLASGVYTGQIVVSDAAASNSPQQVAVVLAVRDVPGIWLSTNSLWSMVNAGGVSTQRFEIRNAGGGTLRYTNRSDRAWMTLAPTSGTVMTESDSIAVSYHAGALANGTYTGAITVDGVYATNTPQIIAVTVEVTNLVVLTVSSSWGAAAPASGSYVYLSNAVVRCAVTGSPRVLVDAQSRSTGVCTGWVGTGSVPALGAATNTGPIALEVNSSVTWLWVLTDLVVSNQTVTGRTARVARDTITATNRYRVVSGGNVSLEAGRSVRLSPGFSASTGSTFRASTRAD